MEVFVRRELRNGFRNWIGISPFAQTKPSARAATTCHSNGCARWAREGYAVAPLTRFRSSPPAPGQVHFLGLSRG